MGNITLTDKIIDMILSLAPAIFTGIITFLITKYSYHKNRPLDKIEIAYNRVYYPIYKLIRNKEIKEIDQQELQNKMSFIMNKYDKYISQSTRYTYKNYIDQFNLNDYNANKLLNNFNNNIISYNAKLRLLLGYPQSNIIEMYKFVDVKTKYAIKSLICVIIIYAFALLYQFFKYDWLVYVALICFVYFVYMVLRVLINAIVSLIKGLKKS